MQLFCKFKKFFNIFFKGGEGGREVEREGGIQLATLQRGPRGLSPDSQGFSSTECAEKSLGLEVRAMGVWSNSALKDLGGPKGVPNLPRVLSHLSTVRVGVLKSLWSYRLPSELE